MNGPRWSSPYLVSHGCSLSNAVLFVAEALGLFASEGIEVDVPRFRTMETPAALLGDGRAALGTVAFIHPLIHHHLPDPPIVVAGSGRRGVSLVAQPGIADAGELRGRPIGTFAGDPLQLLVHDIFAARQLGPVREVRFDTLEDGLASFANGSIAAITMVEPYARQLRLEGGVELSDGTEVWGPDFPDTVLVASESLLRSQPQTVRGVIRAIRNAERFLDLDPEYALEGLGEHFPGFSARELAQSLPSMPPGTDIRHLEPVFLNSWPGLRSLGLVSGSPPARAPTCWGPLEEVLFDEAQSIQQTNTT